MITWLLLYKLFNNKHSMKIAKMQVFRLRRKKKKKKTASIRKSCAIGCSNGGKERKSSIPVYARPYM